MYKKKKSTYPLFHRSLVKAIKPIVPALFSSAVLFAANTSFAGPEGGQVTGGDGTISQYGTTTTIHQVTDRMSIDWASYDLDENERVHYIQPDSNSVSLNRILSNTGSHIQGRIDANGHVILMNPNGVFFGKNAVVNAGGILASGLSIDADDFMNGDFTFHAIEGTEGVVINSGILNAATGGSVALIGKQVKNEGLISANLGAMTFAAGREAVVTFDTEGRIGVRVTQEVLQEDIGVDPAILNEGEIQAQDSQVLLTASVSKDIFAQAMNTGDMDYEGSVVVHDDGSITLGGGADVVNTGLIDVSGERGGQAVVLGENVSHSGQILANASVQNSAARIEIHSGDTTLLQEGSLTSANGIDGTAGDIKILGDKVGLLGDAQVEATGTYGSGRVLVGGDIRGENAYVPNASAVYFGRSASIVADALYDGKAGTVVLYGSDSLRAYGDISAAGLNYAGGGFVETSSGFVDLILDVAVGGVSSQGEWLIDPWNITIGDGAESDIDGPGEGGNPDNVFDPDYINGSGNSYINISALQNALQGGGSVYVQTGDVTSSPNQEGNITLESELDLGGITEAELILQAHNDIKIEASILDAVLFTGNLNLTLEAGGDVIVEQGIEIQLNGGQFTSTGNNFTLGAFGTTNTTLNTGGGDVALNMSGDINIYGSVVTESGAFTAGAITEDGNVTQWVDNFYSHFIAEDGSSHSGIINTVSNDSAGHIKIFSEGDVELGYLEDWDGSGNNARNISNFELDVRAYDDIVLWETIDTEPLLGNPGDQDNGVLGSFSFQAGNLLDDDLQGLYILANIGPYNSAAQDDLSTGGGEDTDYLYDHNTLDISFSRLDAAGSSNAVNYFQGTDSDNGVFINSAGGDIDILVDGDVTVFGVGEYRVASNGAFSTFGGDLNIGRENGRVGSVFVVGPDRSIFTIQAATASGTGGTPDENSSGSVAIYSDSTVTLGQVWTERGDSADIGTFTVFSGGDESGAGILSGCVNGLNVGRCDYNIGGRVELNASTLVNGVVKYFDIDFTNNGNQFRHSMSFTGRNVSVTRNGSEDFHIGGGVDSYVHGDLNVVLTANNNNRTIFDEGNIAVAGIASFITEVGSADSDPRRDRIVLDADNDFFAVRLNTYEAVVKDINDLQLGRTDTNNLTVTVGGNLSNYLVDGQPPESELVDVNSLFTVAATPTSDLSLVGANLFNTVYVDQANNVTLFDGNGGMQFGINDGDLSHISGDLSITTSGGVFHDGGTIENTERRVRVDGRTSIVNHGYEVLLDNYYNDWGALSIDTSGGQPIGQFPITAGPITINSNGSNSFISGELSLSNALHVVDLNASHGLGLSSGASITINVRNNFLQSGRIGGGVISIEGNGAANEFVFGSGATSGRNGRFNIGAGEGDDIFRVYGDVSAIMNGGADNDHFYVYTSYSSSMNGLDGDDRFYISNNSISISNIDGGEGDDQLLGYGYSDQTGSTGRTVVWVAEGRGNDYTPVVGEIIDGLIEFSGIEALRSGPGRDRIYIEQGADIQEVFSGYGDDKISVYSRNAIAIDAGRGDDRFDLYEPLFSGHLVGGEGVNDSDSIYYRVARDVGVELGETSLATFTVGNDSSTHSFEGIEYLQASDEGSNMLHSVDDNFRDWSIWGTNSGTLSYVSMGGAGNDLDIEFHNFAHLVGSDGDDSFIFEVGGDVTKIDGGGGDSNIVDYSGIRSTTAIHAVVVDDFANGEFVPIDTSGVTQSDFLTNIQGVRGNNSTANVLRLEGSFDQTLAWRIGRFNESNSLIFQNLDDGSNDGEVSNMRFLDFANLQGGDAMDNFIVQEDGSIQSIEADYLNSGLNEDSLTVLISQQLSWEIDGDTASGNFRVGGGDDPKRFQNIHQINSGGGTDTFSIRGLAQSIIVDGGAGNDHFVIKEGGEGWMIHGGDTGGSDTLEVESQLFSLGHTWSINATNQGQVSRGNNEIVEQFTGIDNLIGGNGADDFSLDGAKVSGLISGSRDAGASGQDNVYIYDIDNATVQIGSFYNENINLVNISSITASGVNMELIGDNLDNSWNLGSTRRSLTGAGYDIQFSGFASLVGGKSIDVFSIDSAQSLEGIDSIDGGDGSGDSIDASMATESITFGFSQFSSAADVSLAGVELLNAANGIQPDVGHRLIGGNLTENFWDVTAYNAGSIQQSDQRMLFNGISHLVGRDQHNQFTFWPLGNLSGDIVGGKLTDNLSVRLSEAGHRQISFDGGIGENNVTFTGQTSSQFNTSYSAGREFEVGSLVFSRWEGNEEIIPEVEFSFTNVAGIDIKNSVKIHELEIINTSVFTQNFELNSGGVQVGSNTPIVYAAPNSISIEANLLDTVQLSESIDIDGVFSVVNAEFEVNSPEIKLSANDGIQFLNTGGIGSIEDRFSISTSSLELDGPRGDIFMHQSGNESLSLRLSSVSEATDFDLAADTDVNAENVLVWAGDISLESDGDITLGASSWDNQVNQLSGEINLASGGDITLLNISSFFGDVTADNFYFTTSGNANVVGDINIAEGTVLTTLESANPSGAIHSIDFSGDNHQFGRVFVDVQANESQIHIADSSNDVISFGTSNSSSQSSDITVSANGGVNLQSVMAGNLSIQSSSGDVSLGDGASLVADTVAITAARNFTMQTSGSSVQATDTISILSGGDMFLTALNSISGDVLLDSGGRIADNNGDSLNITASQLVATSELGFGGFAPHSMIETSVSSFDVRNNVGGVGVQNDRSTSILALISNSGGVRLHNTDGNVTLINSVTDGTYDLSAIDTGDIRYAGGVIDALYGFGNVVVDIDNGHMAAIPAADTSRPEIVGKEVSVSTSQGFGINNRPIVVYASDHLYIKGNGIFPGWGFGVRPSMGSGLSSDEDLSEIVTITTNVSDLLVDVEDEEDVDPAVFNDVRNYSYDSIAIRLPRDQLFELDDEKEE